MKLSSVQLARSIWLFIASDLNPGGLDIFSILEEVVKRYEFRSYPKSIDEINTQVGVKFQAGIFMGRQNESIGVDLTIYNDGFLADTRSSTIDSDRFLDDLLVWLSKEYNFIPYKEVQRGKVYISELYFSMGKCLYALNPKLKKFAGLLSSKIIGYNDIDLEVGGISLWRDPGKIGQPGAFRIERQEGLPFKENRYYSVAPLQTEVHIEVLEEFEKILTS